MTNPDFARALLLVAIFVAAMTVLRVYDGLKVEGVRPPGSPAASSVEIEARSTLTGAP